MGFGRAECQEEGVRSEKSSAKVDQRVEQDDVPVEEAAVGIRDGLLHNLEQSLLMQMSCDQQWPADFY